MGQHDLNWINPIGLCPLPLLANRESASTLWSFPKVLNCFQRTVSCNSNVNCWGQNQWKSYSSSKYKFKTHLFHFRFFFLLPWRTEVKVTQSCLTLWDPMDYTVHGILQARVLEWVAFPSPGDLPNPGIKPRSTALRANSLPAEPQGKPSLTLGRYYPAVARDYHRKPASKSGYKAKRWRETSFWWHYLKPALLWEFSARWAKSLPLA